MVAEDDHLQIYQNYGKLKKQKQFESNFVLNVISSKNIFWFRFDLNLSFLLKSI